MIPLARIPDHFSKHGVKLALVEFLRLQHYCLPRHNLCHRAGAGSQQRWSSFRHRSYLGFCCRRLMATLQVQTVSLAQTALRLYPRRRAICAALRPAAQSFLSSATSSASQPMGDAIHRLLTTGWSTPGLPGESIPAWHSRGCSQPLISSAGHLTSTEIPKRTVQR